MGKFVIYQTKKGYTFCLKAANGETIASAPEAYQTLKAVNDTVGCIKEYAHEAPAEDQTKEGYISLPYPKFEIFHDNGQMFRFRLMKAKDTILAVSESYTAKANCKNGIKSVSKNSQSAPVIVDIPER